MKTRKFFALFLATLILISASALFANAAANDIFLASDIHNKTTNFSNVLSAVKKDTNIEVVALAGDYELSVSQLDSYVNAAFPNATKIYTTGNHDTAGNGLQKTGEAFVNEHFVLYMIAQGDFKKNDTVNALRTYLSAYNTNDDTDGKPLFIVCHMPLHKKRGDNTTAHLYTQLLNEYGDTIDIVYLFGHNHSVEKQLYFIHPGEEMTPAGGNNTKLKFTYLTAGYIKEGYGIVVRVNDNNITFQRYNTSGKYDSAIVVERKIVAFNCDKGMHKMNGNPFDSKIKAYVYTCPACNTNIRERLAGDCLGDGTVDSADARTALRCSVNLDQLDPVSYAIADTDKDGIVSSSDARNILRKAVGLATDNNASWTPIPVDENGNIAA